MYYFILIKNETVLTIQFTAFSLKIFWTSKSKQFEKHLPKKIHRYFVRSWSDRMNAREVIEVKIIQPDLWHGKKHKS